MGTYKVKSKDNPWNIAKNLGIKVSELSRLNPQAKIDEGLIYPDQELIVPSKTPTVTPIKKGQIEASALALGAFTKNTVLPVVSLLAGPAGIPLAVAARKTNLDITAPVPKQSAENMKNHLSFMWDEYLADRNKYMGDNPYTSVEDYFERTGAKEVQLPYTSVERDISTSIPGPSMEFVEALGRLNADKDYVLDKNLNYLDFYNSDYLNTHPTVTRVPSAREKFGKYYTATTGRPYNRNTDPSLVTVGKYDWVIGNDGVARVSDDYDFGMTPREIKRSLTSKKPKNIIRVIA